MARHNRTEKDARTKPRQKFERLTPAEFGPGNGGMLLDLSEDGASFQAVAAVGQEQPIRFHFRLPGAPTRIEAAAQVVWSNASGKGGGLRFVDLSAAARHELQTWIAGDVSSTAVPPQQKMLAQAMSAQTAPVTPRPVSSPKPDLPQLDRPKLERPASDHNAPHAKAAPHRTTQQKIAAARALTSAAPERPAPPAQIEAPSPKPPRVAPVLPAVLAPKTLNASASRSAFSPLAMVAVCMAVVMALIVGIHVHANTSRPAIAENQTLPPATSPAPAPSKSDVLAAMAADNPPANSSAVTPESVGAIPAADQAPPSETFAPQLKVSPAVASIAAKPAPVTENLAIAPRMNALAHSTTALLAPHRPTSPVASREASVNADIAPGFNPVDLLAAAPAMPGPREPLQPSERAQPEKSAPAASFQPALLIRGAAPVYPPRTKKDHAEEAVQLDVTVGADGVPRNLQLMSGDPNLASEAQRAISRWRYIPAVLDGRPVESHIVVNINFQSKP